MVEERLQKVMAAAGVGSRRSCERLIEEGRVAVNGAVITELGTKVDPNRDSIAVDGNKLDVGARTVYIKLHKPRGILSDIGGDTRGRQTVADLLPTSVGRVFPVGRLDLPSEGLMLLTNDGRMAHRLTHPRFEHPKTYFVLVDKMPKLSDLQTLRQGVEISEGRTAPAQVSRVEGPPRSIQLERVPQHGVWLRFVLREGKKRQIRHMVAAVGLSTLRLVRWAIGPLVLGDLPAGQWRYLPSEDITALQRATTKRTDQPHWPPKSRNASQRRSSQSRSKRRQRSGSAKSTTRRTQKLS